MKYLLSALGVIATSAAFAVSGVVPPAYTATEGNNGFFVFSTTQTRTYQVVYDSSLLTSFTGMQITGFSLRLNGGSGNWPSAGGTMTDFDIYLGESVDPTARVATFADNFIGTPTQVRDGSYTFNANDWTGGAGPNPFGPVFTFDTPYLYTGGDLGVEMRYTQNPTPANIGFDGLSPGAPEYNTTVAGGWTASNTGTTGSTNANVIIMELHAVPEPATMIALGAGLAALAARRQRK